MNNLKTIEAFETRAECTKRLKGLGLRGVALAEAEGTLDKNSCTHAEGGLWVFYDELNIL